ncbi:uncharacterized protein LOC120341160 isoform X1 [Styela clava]
MASDDHAPAVKLESLDHILQDRSYLHLSELPEGLYNDGQNCNQNTSSENDDSDIDIKIINTFSLANTKPHIKEKRRKRRSLDSYASVINKAVKLDHVDDFTFTSFMSEDIANCFDKSVGEFFDDDEMDCRWLDLRLMISYKCQSSNGVQPMLEPDLRSIRKKHGYRGINQKIKPFDRILADNLIEEDLVSDDDDDDEISSVQEEAEPEETVDETCDVADEEVQLETSIINPQPKSSQHVDEIECNTIDHHWENVVEQDAKCTNISARKEVSNNVFMSKELDELLQKESSNSQKQLFRVETVKPSPTEIKYQTPTSQSSYIKTLQSALERRKALDTKMNCWITPQNYWDSVKEKRSQALGQKLDATIVHDSSFKSLNTLSGNTDDLSTHCEKSPPFLKLILHSQAEHALNALSKNDISDCIAGKSTSVEFSSVGKATWRKLPLVYKSKSVVCSPAINEITNSPESSTTNKRKMFESNIYIPNKFSKLESARKFNLASFRKSLKKQGLGNNYWNPNQKLSENKQRNNVKIAPSCKNGLGNSSTEEEKTAIKKSKEQYNGNMSIAETATKLLKRSNESSQESGPSFVNDEGGIVIIESSDECDQDHQTIEKQNQTVSHGDSILRDIWELFTIVHFPSIQGADDYNTTWLGTTRVFKILSHCEDWLKHRVLIVRAILGMDLNLEKHDAWYIATDVGDYFIEVLNRARNVEDCSSILPDDILDIAKNLQKDNRLTMTLVQIYKRKVRDAVLGNGIKYCVHKGWRQMHELDREQLFSRQQTEQNVPDILGFSDAEKAESGEKKFYLKLLRAGQQIKISVDITKLTIVGQKIMTSTHEDMTCSGNEEDSTLESEPPNILLDSQDSSITGNRCICMKTSSVVSSSSHSLANVHFDHCYAISEGRYQDSQSCSEASINRSQTSRPSNCLRYVSNKSSCPTLSDMRNMGYRYQLAGLDENEANCVAAVEEVVSELKFAPSSNWRVASDRMKQRKCCVMLPASSIANTYVPSFNFSNLQQSRSGSCALIGQSFVAVDSSTADSLPSGNEKPIGPFPCENYLYIKHPDFVMKLPMRLSSPKVERTSAQAKVQSSGLKAFAVTPPLSVTSNLTGLSEANSGETGLKNVSSQGGGAKYFNATNTITLKPVSLSLNLCSTTTENSLASPTTPFILLQNTDLNQPNGNQLRNNLSNVNSIANKESAIIATITRRSCIDAPCSSGYQQQNVVQCDGNPALLRKSDPVFNVCPNPNLSPYSNPISARKFTSNTPDMHIVISPVLTKVQVSSSGSYTDMGHIQTKGTRDDVFPIGKHKARSSMLSTDQCHASTAVKFQKPSNVMSMVFSQRTQLPLVNTSSKVSYKSDMPEEITQKKISSAMSVDVTRNDCKSILHNSILPQNILVTDVVSSENHNIKPPGCITTLPKEFKNPNNCSSQSISSLVGNYSSLTCSVSSTIVKSSISVGDVVSLPPTSEVDCKSVLSESALERIVSTFSVDADGKNCKSFLDNNIASRNIAVTGVTFSGEYKKMKASRLMTKLVQYSKTPKRSSQNTASTKSDKNESIEFPIKYCTNVSSNVSAFANVSTSVLSHGDVMSSMPTLKMSYESDVTEKVIPNRVFSNVTKNACNLISHNTVPYKDVSATGVTFSGEYRKMKASRIMPTSGQDLKISNHSSQSIPVSVETCSSLSCSKSKLMGAITSVLSCEVSNCNVVNLVPISKGICESDILKRNTQKEIHSYISEDVAGNDLNLIPGVTAEGDHKVKKSGHAATLEEDLKTSRFSIQNNVAIKSSSSESIAFSCENPSSLFSSVSSFIDAPASDGGTKSLIAVSLIPTLQNSCETSPVIASTYRNTWYVDLGTNKNLCDPEKKKQQDNPKPVHFSVNSPDSEHKIFISCVKSHRDKTSERKKIQSSSKILLRSYCSQPKISLTTSSDFQARSSDLVSTTSKSCINAQPLLSTLPFINTGGLKCSINKVILAQPPLKQHVTDSRTIGTKSLSTSLASRFGGNTTSTIPFLVGVISKPSVVRADVTRERELTRLRHVVKTNLSKFNVKLYPFKTKRSHATDKSKNHTRRLRLRMTQRTAMKLISKGFSERHSPIQLKVLNNACLPGNTLQTTLHQALGSLQNNQHDISSIHAKMSTACAKLLNLDSAKEVTSVNYALGVCIKPIFNELLTKFTPVREVCNSKNLDSSNSIYTAQSLKPCPRQLEYHVEGSSETSTRCLKSYAKPASGVLAKSAFDCSVADQTGCSSKVESSIDFSPSSVSVDAGKSPTKVNVPEDVLSLLHNLVGKPQIKKSASPMSSSSRNAAESRNIFDDIISSLGDGNDKIDGSVETIHSEIMPALDEGANLECEPSGITDDKASTGTLCLEQNKSIPVASKLIDKGLCSFGSLPINSNEESGLCDKELLSPPCSSWFVEGEDPMDAMPSGDDCSRRIERHLVKIEPGIHVDEYVKSKDTKMRDGPLSQMLISIEEESFATKVANLLDVNPPSDASTLVKKRCQSGESSTIDGPITPKKRRTTPKVIQTGIIDLTISDSEDSQAHISA